MNGIDLSCRLPLADFVLEADLTLPGRGVTALFGPSGSGKTTLLRCVAGLARAAGRVEINGECWQDDARGLFLPTHRRALGYVFQEASLFAHIQSSFPDNYAKMGEALGRNKIEPIGQQCGIYYMFDMEKGITDMAAAMPVPAGTKNDGFTMAVIPPMPYYHLDYYGDYAKSYPAYEALDKYVIAKGKEPKPEMVLEQYVNDPMVEKDTAKWLTAIHYFLK